MFQLRDNSKIRQPCQQKVGKPAEVLQVLRGTDSPQAKGKFGNAGEGTATGVIIYLQTYKSNEDF